MSPNVPVVGKVLAGAAIVGVLSLGGAGFAGAAAPSTPAAPGVTAPSSHSGINCARADRVLARIGKAESRIAAGLPRLTAAEAAAKQAGNTKRADRLQRVITRLEGSTFKSHLTKVSQRIEATCHVSAPTAG